MQALPGGQGVRGHNSPALSSESSCLPASSQKPAGFSWLSALSLHPADLRDGPHLLLAPKAPATILLKDTHVTLLTGPPKGPHLHFLNQACKVIAGAVDSSTLCRGKQMPVVVAPVDSSQAGASAHSSIHKYSATARILGKGWSWPEAARALCQALGRCVLQGGQSSSPSDLSQYLSLE